MEWVEWPSIFDYRLTGSAELYWQALRHDQHQDCPGGHPAQLPARQDREHEKRFGAIQVSGGSRGSISS